MALNKGYLTSGRDAGSDCVNTPFYAVAPLLKYIPAVATIWAPFDEKWSAFIQTFKENGNTVIYSHIKSGQDFFTYEPQTPYDFIISNPPYSKKDAVLRRLYELNKPFAMLLPLNSLQGKSRFACFKQGIQLLAFDKRVNYHASDNYQMFTRGNCFASAYFCKDFLPRDLIIEELIEFERPLISGEEAL